MPRCTESPPKHRTTKPHGSHGRSAGSKNDYKHGMKGHTWKREGNKRYCALCNKVHKLHILSETIYRIIPVKEK